MNKGGCDPPQSGYNQEGNMKLTVCVLAVLVGAGLAIDGPRLNVLTGDARLMLDDFSEIWAYPGTMAKYQFGIVTSESANDEMDEFGLGWFGGVMDIDGVTWGATHNHNGNLLEILYHGGSYGLIVGVDYSSQPADTSGEINGEDTMGFDVTFGTDIDLFGDYTDLAIGAGYGSVEAKDVEFTLSKDTDLNLGASVRGHMDGLFNLFPIISVGFSQLKNEIYDEGDFAGSTTTSTISLDFGAGINKMYAPSTQVVFGAFMGLDNTSYSVDEGDAPDSHMKLDILDLKASVEQHLFRWLAFRGGANSVTSYDKTGDADAVIGTAIDSRFGLGIEIGNFTIDADISQSFLHDGPWLIGGDENGFLTNMACTYEF
jgi:hypothetical protein